MADSLSYVVLIFIGIDRYHILSSDDIGETSEIKAYHTMNLHILMVHLQEVLQLHVWITAWILQKRQDRVYIRFILDAEFRSHFYDYILSGTFVVLQYLMNMFCSFGSRYQYHIDKCARTVFDGIYSI